MAYKALYRKYRPDSFSKVYGQDTIVKTLKNIIKNDKLSHAYLFTGPRGTGKTSTAKLFAKAINCLNNNNGDSCNECNTCKSYIDNSNPDIIEMDAASNNGVDEIRDIRSKVSIVPSMSKYKVYIIDEVHMLSTGAFNALLKTLEEPPKHVIFILATTEPQKLPMTVISRCQRFDFKNINNNSMQKCLESIIKSENISISDEALKEIVNVSNGGMRDAIGLLDQANAFCDKKIEKKDIEELTGSISVDEATNILNYIINDNIEEILKITDELSASGKDVEKIVQKMLIYLRKIILYKKANVTNDLTPKLIELSNKYSDTKFFEIINSFLEMLREVKYATDSYVIFEISLIKLIDKLVENPIKSIKNIDYEIIQDNVPRETLIKKSVNVPRETLKPAAELEDLKNIRINNILLEASKKDISYIQTIWENIDEYLINDKYKISAGILKKAKPVAASKKGIIITVPSTVILNKIEENYDNSKQLIEEMCNQPYKIVYIVDEYWKKIRPEYANKVKNKELKELSESEILSKIKKMLKESDSTNDFVDLIEMEG